MSQLPKEWHKRALAIYIYHNNMLLARPDWTVRSTAAKLNISVGAASEALKLARGVIDQPELESLSRREALQKLKEHNGGNLRTG